MSPLPGAQLLSSPVDVESPWLNALSEGVLASQHAPADDLSDRPPFCPQALLIFTTMFIYNGKFSWFKCAENETITFVFPADFSLNNPVSAYWQWTSDSIIQKKACTVNSGIIHNITTTADGYCRIHIAFGYYTFDASVALDYKTSTVTMWNPGKSSSGPFELSVMHINTASIRSTVVYMGTLEWHPYAKGEMTTLVVPYGVAEDAFFGLYHQWTVDAQGVEKANASGVFQDVTLGVDGSTTAIHKAPNHTYFFKFRGREGSFVLSTPTGNKSEENKFTLAYGL